MFIISFELQTVWYEPVLKGSDVYVLQLVVLSFCTSSIVLVFWTEHSIFGNRICLCDGRITSSDGQ